MSLAQMLLPEFDNEMATTRRVLERVPDEKLDWKPHEKSMDLRGLTTHIANNPSWALRAINEDAIDIAPAGGPPPKATPANSVEEALAEFDRNVTAARAAIEGVSDQKLMETWSLLMGGQTKLAMPRLAVLRGFVMNHIIHHRGQLSVYLRLLDIPVPSIYGPSADDSGGF